jgi:hypothetical protein
MKECDYCGRQNHEDAANCRECGSPLSERRGDEMSLVGSEASSWILRTFGWALEQFGSDFFHQQTILVTPTRDHFPDQAKDPHETASLWFARVQAYAGMQQWPCRLVGQEPDVETVVDPVTVIQDAPKGPGGTFSVSNESQPEVLITYNPASVQRPQELVAIFAHELAHYLGHTAGCPPPGGEKNREYATDLLGVFLGFGLFLANSAVQFQQFTGYNNQGWSSASLGYLTEFELTYCLAVFCRLKRIAREEIVPHLKKSLVPVYDDCLDHLQRKEEMLAELAEIRSGAGKGGQS